MDGLLTGAGHTVVIGAGVGNLGGGLGKVRIIRGDDHLYVAGADAEGGPAAGIGGLDHCRSAGCYHYVHLAHQLLGQSHGRLLHNLHQIFRSAQLLQCGVDQIHAMTGHILGAGVWRDDHGITALDDVHAVADRGGNGICGRYQRRHHAQRLGKGRQLFRRVVVDHAHRLLIVEEMPGTQSAAL